MKYRICSRDFLFRLIRFTFLFFFFIFCIQDILVFPGVLFALWNPAPLPPPAVSSFVIKAADGTELQMWVQAAVDATSEKPGRPCLFFHGNGGSMAEFYPIQRWLTRLGFRAYAVDTRGFGASRGWPSERGIEMDAEAAIEEVARREGISPSEVTVVGLSVGTGVSAYLGAKYQLKELVLLAAYSNLRKRASEEPLLGILSPLLRYEFPVRDYVSQLKETCLVVARGGRDQIISPRHSEEILQAYQGTQPVRSVLIDGAGHNDLVFLGGDKIAEAILSCRRGK